MKQYIFFGAVFFALLFLMIATAETIWSIPLCAVSMAISFVCGRLWREMMLVSMQKIDGVTVEVYNEELPEAEIRQYINRARAAKPGVKLLSVQLVVDGEEVDISAEYAAVPFERIRRITGYLTGRYGAANDAKKSEIADRVTHDTDRDLEEVLAEVNAHVAK